MAKETRNCVEFRHLLQKAIGDRKQADFAKEAKISVSHLNRLLNNDMISVPTPATLTKIALASNGEVSLRSLKESCGYYENKQDKNFSDEVAINAEAASIRNGVENMISRIGRFDGVGDFMDSVTMLYSEEKTTMLITRLPEEANDIVRKHNAEKGVHVTVKWERGGKSAALAFALFFSETKNGSVIIQDSAFSLKSLLETGHPVAKRRLFALSEEKDANIGNVDIVVVTKQEELSAEERMIKAIFGDENRLKRPHTIEGLGFKVKSGDRIPDAKACFNRASELVVETDEGKTILDKILSGTHEERIAKCKDAWRELSSGSEEEDKLFEFIVDLDALDGVDETFDLEACMDAIRAAVFRKTGIRLFLVDCSEDENDDDADKEYMMLFDNVSPWLLNEAEKNLKSDTHSALIDAAAKAAGKNKSEWVYHVVWLEE